MRKTKGFTLIELLVVIAILALLVSLLMPSLAKVRELARRVKCEAHVKGIAHALSMYVAEPAYRNEWPWTQGAIGQYKTNTNRELPPIPANQLKQRSVTACVYLLYRESYVEMGNFICPSDDDVTIQTNIKRTDNYWDFDSNKRLSYSYVVPLVNGDNGVSYQCKDPARVAMVADKNPVRSGKSLSGWDDDMSRDAIRNNLSQNHAGEMINVAWADFHVSDEIRADIGVKNDCIYSAGGENGANRGETSIKQADHFKDEDSFLDGPFP